jgi:hypothetical protein
MFDKNKDMRERMREELREEVEAEKIKRIREQEKQNMLKSLDWELKTPKEKLDVYIERFKRNVLDNIRKGSK